MGGGEDKQRKQHQTPPFISQQHLPSFPHHWASQVALVVKNAPANAENIRDGGSIPGSGRFPGNSLQYSCLENPNVQRSLVGYTPFGGKESDTTEATKHARTPHHYY